MKKSIKFIGQVILIVVFLFAFNKTIQADEAPSVTPRCHNCDDGGSSITPSPSEPSTQELQQKREVAIHDANDIGIEYYRRGDWDNAIKAFEEALEYGPDDEVILGNLKKARKKAQEAKAARQLKIINEEEQEIYIELSDEAAAKKAGKGIDTPTSESVSVDGRISNKEPYVPDNKRTPEITSLEKERNGIKGRRFALEKQFEELKKSPNSDYMKISRVKQEISSLQNKEHYINFRIGELLR